MLALAIALLAPAARAQQAPALEGVWRSDGYGLVLKIDADSLHGYEVTAVGCLPAFQTKRTPHTGPGQLFADSGQLRLLLLPGASANEFRLHEAGAASDVIFQRALRLPDHCAVPSANDAVATFDVFWQTYREQYPFFAAKQIDWDQVRAANRPRAIGATPESLFAVLRGMIEPLRDAHTYIGSPDDRNLRYGGRRVDPDTIGARGRTRAEEIITTKYLRTKLHFFANGRVQFGMLPDSIGYLRITAFAGYVPGKGYEEAHAALEAALDTMFADTRGWRGLIIDVRINGGGADPLGLAIAARLTSTPYTAYAKVARADPVDAAKMTPPQPSVVTPSTRPGWRGPVAELTSRYSVSAAETFTQALMGRRPAIERVGENTQGVFSDVLGRKLPNGWRFGLPNELFLTAQGTSFDGAGIPPTIAVPTMTTAELTEGKDRALERAMAVIRK
ncbi:MAG: S41 family peptidase [Gemmatimonadota bacterium]|nr:S41 family peptidase [Gemmatimonadota bacterium]